MKEDIGDNEYESIDSFHASNEIFCDEDYILIIRARINRPRIIVKRLPSEK